jgi:hypothetical protein
MSRWSTVGAAVGIGVLLSYAGADLLFAGDGRSGPSDVGSVSVDPKGWALHPAIAWSLDGTAYAAWAQHTRPEDWQFVGIYVKRWTNDTWQSLGGRIGHREGESSADWPEAHAPSIAVLNDVPYVAWYEGGGYGWSSKNINSSVFVAHWDGARWVSDRNSGTPNGALNTMPERAARGPALAVSGGTVYAAWIETVESRGSPNVVVVKRLSGGQWMDVGQPFRTEQRDSCLILDVALADVGGEPFVAWSEQSRGEGTGRTGVYVVRWDGSRWSRVGRALNVSPDGRVNLLAMTAVGRTPYVAWQERTTPAGNNKIYVRSWTGKEWVSTGSSLNVDSARGEAGRPGLATDGSRVWLTWTEGVPGERAKLYARALSPGGWSAPLGPLNASLSEGAADTPSAVGVPGGMLLIWAEKGLPPATKQIFVRRIR